MDGTIVGVGMVGFFVGGGVGIVVGFAARSDIIFIWNSVGCKERKTRVTP